MGATVRCAALANITQPAPAPAAPSPDQRETIDEMETKTLVSVSMALHKLGVSCCPHMRGHITALAAFAHIELTGRTD